MKITLRAARVNSGMTQTEVAREVGVLRDTIGRWENGQTSPKTEQLKKLCELYEVSIAELKI